MLHGDHFLVIIPAVLALLMVLYIPACAYFYYLIRMRGNRQLAFTLSRNRDIAGFFGERPVDLWRGGVYVGPVVFTTLIVLVGFALAFPALVGFLVEKGIISGGMMGQMAREVQLASQPVFFGFLGAYLFALQVTLRRYLDSDLTPDAYVTAATRILFALIISGILGLALPMQLRSKPILGVDLATLVNITAFVAGIFPEDGLRSIINLVKHRVPIGRTPDDVYALSRLTGLSQWQALRLNIEGIETIHNLANAEMYDLVRRTRYSVQQIFDWIDQAILAIHMPTLEEFKQLQAYGIRGYVNFLAAYTNDTTKASLRDFYTTLPKPYRPGEHAPANNRNYTPEEAQQRLDLLFVTVKESPSVDSVRLFWRYKSAHLTRSYEQFSRGQAYEALGDYDRAIAAYSLALERNEMDPVLRLCRGEARGRLAQNLLSAGRWREAEEKFQEATNDFVKAIEQDPFAPQAYYSRGRLNLERGRYEAAINDFDQVLKLARNDYEALNYRALAHQKQGELRIKLLGQQDGIDTEYAAAEADLLRARTVNDQYSTTYVNLGNIYLLQAGRRPAEGQPPVTCQQLLDKAKKALEDAIERDARCAEAFWGLARLYAEQRDYNQALTAFDRAIDYMEHRSRQDSGDEDAHRAPLTMFRVEEVWLDKGRLYMRQAAEQGDPSAREQAIFTFDMAIKRNQSFAAAYEARAEANYEANNYVAAAADYDMLINTLKQDRPEIYLQRGKTYLKLQRYREATQDLTWLINRERSNPDGYLYRGLAYQGLERNPEALADFKRLLELKQDHMEAVHNNLGTTYMMLRQFDLAEEHLNQALALEPNYAEAYSNRAQVRLHQIPPGLHLAEADLTEAIDRSRTQPLFFYNRGLVRIELERFDEASQDFREAVGLDAAYTQTVIERARVFMHDGDYVKAHALTDGVLVVRPNDPAVVFEALRLASLEGRTNGALEFVPRLGTNRGEWIERMRPDPDFLNLRQDPAFASLFGSDVSTRAPVVAAG